jgi:hypothetical protein
MSERIYELMMQEGVDVNGNDWLGNATVDESVSSCLMVMVEGLSWILKLGIVV